jgi:hypothetical protein
VIKGFVGTHSNLIWINDATFNPSAFDPVRRVLDIVRECLDEVVLKRDDISGMNLLSKSICVFLIGFTFSRTIALLSLSLLSR